MTETVDNNRNGGKSGTKRKRAVGLTVTRLHTTEGVHPYDEVRWERRDVVMTNWRDGTVNFEQRGVEFPESWSANATNIVTSKYFRGAAGSPERESSLRQLIDRVVGVYREAGIEHGYFATDADAEVFAHELTWMLLHQVFSFNSPVWFNVGTSSPQQVSACLPGDALVSTPAGLVPIGELVEHDAVGTKVFDAHGLTTILATKANGVRDVIRLHTEAGQHLDVTPDHVVWRSTGEGAGQWVEAGTLRRGDQLEWHEVEPADRTPSRVERVGIVRIEPLGETEVYDIQTESGEFLADGLRVHNCFILAVDDTMESILNWYREEGLIFKGGSGAGLNLSRIRSSKELLSSGGTASGPVSFMRGADASAGTIKSGGATRRAAKMVVLDVDHPDIEEFVQTKAKEEAKVRVLRDAGFDMDLGGADITSVQYQNANNSVRVTDEFMRAVEADAEFGLRARMTGEIIERTDAKKLFRGIAEAAWACADPGIQYDGMINDWHTCPESGRISASNPCFPADQRVLTDTGLVPIGELVRRATDGATFGVYTNDVTNADEPVSAVQATMPTRYMVTGTNEILELRFRDGSRLRCTPNHRVWTANREWVRADELTAEDRVVRSIEYAPRSHASAALPSLAIDAGHIARGWPLAEVPEKWSPELAGYLGWLVGDGCLTAQGAVTVYAGDWEQQILLPRHSGLLATITGVHGKPSVQANGTRQLRAMRGRFRTFLRMLGVSDGRSAEKVVPASLYEAPEESVRAFLRALFDADGCVVNQEIKGTRYVGLGSRSEELLIGVQELLASLGIGARIHRAGTRAESFSYVRKDGTEATYRSDGPSFDLRITGRHIGTFAERIGFDHPAKAAKLDVVRSGYTFYQVDETTRLRSRESRGFERTYNLTEPRNHSYVVSGVVVANCSEYMHLDNSSCNLASLNLMKFLDDDGTFDAPRFAKAVELVITAMDISICFADFPTEPIADTTRKFRQLGIGYANLGALLMATGHAYDSEGGRALAAAITSLMTGAAYKRSAELAGVVGPYDGYTRNTEPHQRVMRKHAAANDEIRTFPMSLPVHKLATKKWKESLSIGERNGWRNAQASVLAPTGCLTADTLVTTDRGLARLGEIGDVYGDRWQDIDRAVSTDEGPRRATKFFVNGEEPTRRIVTEGGYTIQGTLAHRIKVVDAATGEWVWRRMADVAPGDTVPLQMRTLVGAPRRVVLPVLDQAYYAGDRRLVVPDALDADLAELVGYFMGDGSLHAKGLRFCVADTDLDVVERLRILGKQLFGIEAAVTPAQGYQEVAFPSVRLARWWQAAGFAKRPPAADHVGTGWSPHIPAAVLESNDPEVYATFLRGLFEADGTVLEQVPSLTTAAASFAAEIRTMLLALGMATTTRGTVSALGGPMFQVRLRDLDHARTFDDTVGFISDRKNRLLPVLEPARSGNRDCTPDYLFEPVAENADGGVQPTFDLSVPDNVTYIAAGFVSHNTIGLMMDCDTTGIEPDLALVKFKKLVGGGSMQIVNQTVPRALTRLGYQNEQMEAIVEYVGEHGHVVDAPSLHPEHYEVFDCAMGERVIAAMGHVRMMAAVQPFLSGAISKTVNMPEMATVDDVEKIYLEGWRLGLKALAIYRDNCKVGQPLSAGKSAKASGGSEAAAPTEQRPIRRRLPKKRPSETVSFTVGGAEGYLTAGSYPDGGLGEIFVKLGKQGSTLSGVMDAFSMSISVGLQYGIPLEFYVSKFSNLRFEPAGMTDDPDVRIATSVLDYLFRRLALDHLTYEKRAQLGILSADERTTQVADNYPDVDLEGLRTGVESTSTQAARRGVTPAPVEVGSSTELLELRLGKAADAPLCMTCGTKMRPAGSCYLCEGCGSTSGCS